MSSRIYASERQDTVAAVVGQADHRLV